MTKCRVALLFIAILFLVSSRTDAQGSARPPYASREPLPTPTVFGEGMISTSDMELNAAFTPDGRTIYFTKRTPRLQLWTILESRFVRGRWSTPAVASFSGQYSDFDPIVSPDGSKLFWSSNRPIEGQPSASFDLWMVDRTPTGWSEPRHLDGPVSSPASDVYPSVTRDGTLYFASTRPGGSGSYDIYRSRLVNGRYGEPENLGDSVNSRFSDGDPYIAPDESYLIFVSYNRPEGLGDGDLYISFNRNGTWSKAENLGPSINSSALDFCPIVSPDGRYLFFTSERGFADHPPLRRLTYAELIRGIRSTQNGLGNIYQVDLPKSIAGSR